MAQAPTTRKLGLTRDQLASFLQDHEQIKQFENLFATVDSEVAPNAVTEATTLAQTAYAMGNEALAGVSALNNLVAPLVTAPPPTGGTVTSVAASGGTTGLTFTGSPITTSGTLVLGGTLAITNGGTGATTAAGARANLEAAKSGANSDITSLSGITGGISTPDYIDFDTAATVTRATGRLWWDNADGIQTLNLGMAGSNATLQIGEEMYFRIKASSAITEGQVVMFTGTVGNSGALTGAPATGLTKDTASYVMGVATENIANNGWGYVTQFGLVRGINTTGGAEAWVDGQILYYNPAVAGGLTKTVPSAPNAKVEVAAVVKAGTNGSLFIRPVARFALGQLNDVETAAATNLDLLQYNGSSGYWQHVPPTTITIGTATNLAGGAANRIAYQTGPGATSFITAPTTANTFLEWSGSAFQWSANPLGTVTSVAMTVPTGLTVSGSPITTSGTLAVSLQSGYSIPTTASQANWDTAYTDRLKWDGGSSGLVAATGRTSLGATTVGSNFFTLTNPSAITFPRINADNSVSALTASDFRTAIGAGTGSGSVTSVDVSGGTTGLSFSGGPITTSGTITMAGTLGVANGGTGTGTAFTAGSVVFAGASGVYSQSNSNFFWDNSNSRLGLGNTNPGYRIDISSSDTTAGIGYAARLRSNSTAGAAALQFTNSGVTAQNGLIAVSDAGLMKLQADGASSAIIFYLNNGTERFRLGPAGQFGLNGTNYGTSGQVLTSQGSSAAPVWATPTTGTVTSVSGTGSVNGITLSGTVTSSGSLTLGGTLSGVSLTSQVSGTLPVANGGTGATTLTGYVKGNGTSAMTASSTVPASDVTGLATVATTGSFTNLSNKPGIQTNGQNVVSGSKTLGSADKGTNLLIVTSGITITFPASGYASGEGVIISNVSGGSVTFSFAFASDMGTTFPNGASIIAICDGGGFWRQYCYSTSRL